MSAAKRRQNVETAGRPTVQPAARPVWPAGDLDRADSASMRNMPRQQQMLIEAAFQANEPYAPSYPGVVKLGILAAGAVGGWAIVIGAARLLFAH